ncbi:hypothetical protein [Sphingomonas sp. ABOLE]|uniref:hypothetical protein n=1 Tax=Sphingomonas sp. ABOLE TaxID=1985878 RepID=UPI000F7EAEC7|nr:hypothetical protein [Sphingomonas sp. ABOLE]
MVRTRTVIAAICLSAVPACYSTASETQRIQLSCEGVDISFGRISTGISSISTLPTQRYIIDQGKKRIYHILSDGSEDDVCYKPVGCKVELTERRFFARLDLGGGSESTVSIDRRSGLATVILSVGDDRTRVYNLWNMTCDKAGDAAMPANRF